MIFQLLGGIIVAAGVFAALLWSIFQGITQRGPLQYVHIATATLSVFGMASISLLSILLAQILGIALLITATTAFVLENSWNRVFPVFPLTFAVALILGLPFAN